MLLVSFNWYLAINNNVNMDTSGSDSSDGSDSFYLFYFIFRKS
ncbi:unnamed protein product, partial [marine sediment metagenome]